MRARRAVTAAAVVAGTAALLAVAPSAHAASVTTVVQGDVVRLVSRVDPVRAAAVPLGERVSWDVAVSASRADGAIDVSLDGTATPGAYTVTVRECAVEWEPGGCPTGERTLGSAPAGTALSLARQSSADERWYRIDVVLEQEIGGATAELTFRAAGAGVDPAPLPPRGGLAVTGGDIVPLAGPAVAAIALGLAVAGFARWRRGRAA